MNAAIFIELQANADVLFNALGKFVGEKKDEAAGRGFDHRPMAEHLSRLRSEVLQLAMTLAADLDRDIAAVTGAIFARLGRLHRQGEYARKIYSDDLPGKWTEKTVIEAVLSLDAVCALLEKIRRLNPGADETESEKKWTKLRPTLSSYITLPDRPAW